MGQKKAPDLYCAFYYVLEREFFFNVCMLCHQVFGSGQVDP